MSIAWLELQICRSAATFEEAKSSNSLQNRCLFMCGAYFCMGSYKRNVVAEIKTGCLYSWGAYFVRVLIILILPVSKCILHCTTKLSVAVLD